MAFTSEDLQAVKDAIIALATGRRVVSVSVSGKTIAYGPAQIKELRELRDVIQAEINAENPGQRYVLTTTTKGL